MAAYDSFVVIMSAAFGFAGALFLTVFLIQHFASRLRKSRH